MIPKTKKKVRENEKKSQLLIPKTKEKSERIRKMP